MIVDLNGQLTPAAKARVSPFDAAYQYGDGLFDTLRTYAGFAFALEAHLQRLADEAKLLHIPFDHDVPAWRRRLNDLLEANDLLEQDARVRIQISRGGAPGKDFIRTDPQEFAAVVFITCQAIDDDVARSQREGIRMLSMQSTFARGNFPQIKSLNYLPSVMAQRFAFAQGYGEACLLNQRNRILEGATSNVFLVEGDRLVTPSARLGLLPGITRSFVMQLGGELGLRVEESAPDLREAMLADEVFVTGSVKEVVPVVAMDSSDVGSGESAGKPGDVTRRLQAAYREAVTKAHQAAG